MDSYFTKKFFIPVLFFISLSALLAQNKGANNLLANIPTPVDYFLNNTNLGREFWIAIPQNDVAGTDLRPLGIEIIVSSPRNTDVTFEVPELGIVKTKHVEAFKATSFSTLKNDFGWTMEVSESEVVSTKGIHLKASEPFTAYVVNVRDYSADGYMAIPVEKCGREYFHCSYYDFFEREWGGRQVKRAGGFIVIATENGTNVNIEVKGQGNEMTAGGHKIGDNFSVSLNAGQTYCVRGDGTTAGVFDISGTRITSNKPVGLISFHQRTKVPSTCPEDRDHLNDMLLPTEKWGKKYITVQFDRRMSGSTKGEGDLFRVMGKKSGQTVNCTYYDKATNNKIGDIVVPLKNPGDFVEELPIQDIPENNTKKSIRGLSIWESTEPFQLLQYAFSFPWDNDRRYAPMFLVVPPAEQYVSKMVFQTPLETDFKENQVTLIAIGDPTDPDAILLKSIKIDNTPVHVSDPRFILNRIPSTNLYWSRVNVGEGAHAITSDTKFSGYVVGFSSANAVGYPLTMALNKIDEPDTIPPKLTSTSVCGDYTYTTTELSTTRPLQIDQGISDIVLFSETSTNYSLVLDKPAEFKPYLGMASVKFYMRVIDKSKPAVGYFAVLDRAGNFRIDSCFFYPDKVDFSSSTVGFGNVRVGKNKSLTFDIINTTQTPIDISKVYLKGTTFSLTALSLPKKLNKDERLTVTVNYTPTQNSVTQEEIDSIKVESNCSIFSIPVSGKGIMPSIAVTDYNFGEILVNTKVCMEEQGSDGLMINNTGNDSLTIMDITGVQPPYLLNKPTSPAMPFVIPPGGFANVKSLCFVPLDSVVYKIDLTVVSNALKGDSTFHIEGKGKPKPGNVPNNETGVGCHLTVIPNPASDDFVNISLGSLKIDKLRIELYDLQGTIIKTIEATGSEESVNIKLQTSGLSPGLYCIRAVSGSWSETARLIITR